MFCHWRYVLDNLFGQVQSITCLGATHIDRRWDEAGTFYRAIIQINPDNFEANYRLGMLSITVQNLDDAFKYLQRAMVLKRDDTKVLYQMGVLYFAMGRPREPRPGRPWNTRGWRTTTPRGINCGSTTRPACSAASGTRPAS